MENAARLDKIVQQLSARLDGSAEAIERESQKQKGTAKNLAAENKTLKHQIDALRRQIGN